MSEQCRCFEERSFDVNDLEIRARYWPVDNGLPVVAIHGWMDNAASFDALAKQLPGCEVLALDLAGNGLSGWRSGHGSYNIWDDFIDILAVADEMGWEQFHLLGHSRGAIVSFLLTSAMPDRIASLAVIDGMLPFATGMEETVSQMRQYLLDQKVNRERSSRTYSTLEEVLEKRCEKNGLSHDECMPLLERALKKTSNGQYAWTHDLRIHGASAIKLTQEHIQQFIDALQRPTLMVAAEQGMASWEELMQLAKEHEFMTPSVVPGGHHLHMTAASAPLVAEAISAWQSTL